MKEAQEAQIKTTSQKYRRQGRDLQSMPSWALSCGTALTQSKVGLNQIGSFSPQVSFYQHPQVHTWEESS